jgi:signal transduction histidine kinase
LFTDDIKAEVDRVDQLIRELLQYTRPLDLEFRDIEVRDLLEDVRARVARAREQQGQPNCPVEVSTESKTFRGDPVLLEQSFENLVANACDAAAPDGHVVIRERAAADGSVVTVRDSGPGIAAEDLNHVFEPFFTRKAAGTGLGLSVAQRIIELHGGELELANHPEGGVVATVRLSGRDRAPGEGDEQDTRCR